MMALKWRKGLIVELYQNETKVLYEMKWELCRTNKSTLQRVGGSQNSDLEWSAVIRELDLAKYFFFVTLG